MKLFGKCIALLTALIVASSSSSSSSSPPLITIEAEIIRPQSEIALPAPPPSPSPRSSSPRSSSSANAADNSRHLTIGLVLPKSAFKPRSYSRTIMDTIKELNSSNNMPDFEYMRRYSHIESKIVHLPDVPTPNDVLKCLHEELFHDPNNIPTVVVYITNTALFTMDTAAAQYFLHLFDFLGIPVIAWNAANPGMEQRKRDSVILQMAPSLYHQADAMLDVLRTFKYQMFFVVTSHVAGHMTFVHAIRERIHSMQHEYEYFLVGHETLSPANVTDTDERLARIKAAKTRIVLLYATESEASDIFGRARLAGFCGREYLWLVTQSVVREVPNFYVPFSYPVGLIGISFDTGDNGVLKTISTAIRIILHGLKLYHDDPENAKHVTVPKPTASCNDEDYKRWKYGFILHRYLKSVNFTVWGTSLDDLERSLQFKEDGSLKEVILDVVNLQDDGVWHKIGTWVNRKVKMRSIVWPGGVLSPPAGVPEKNLIRVTFLEEPPFVSLGTPDETTGLCSDTQIKCDIPPALNGVDPTGVAGNHTFYRCCSGYAIDLLLLLSKDLNLTIEMTRVADGLWGSEQRHGKWNGLIAELMEGKADMAATSLKVNSEREKVVKFSVPFMETGIAIIVAKRTGIISPHAFLEPFDMATWILILVVCVHAAAVSIFAFEWFSPSGYDCRLSSPAGGDNLSLFRSVWLVWAMMVGAAVDVVHPNGLTARFMANVWSTFALVFTAIYTANLAAFMITHEEYHNLKGVKDDRLVHATMHEKPLIFGTIPSGNTDTIMSMNFVQMSRYMKRFSRPTVAEGVAAVKSNVLDAFIYDATVLDYLVGQDDECRLLTVGEWYAKTGYALAFPRYSPYLARFNDKLLLYRTEGKLERLKDYWFKGSCDPKRSLNTFKYSSLTLDQFISAFVLLGCGILLGVFFLMFERCYHAHLRSRLVHGGGGNRSRRNYVLRLISQNLARSLTLEEAVHRVAGKAADHKDENKHRCGDPRCELQLWRAQRQADALRTKAEALANQVEDMRRAVQRKSSDNDNDGNGDGESRPPDPNYYFSNDVFHINQWNV